MKIVSAHRKPTITDTPPETSFLWKGKSGVVWLTLANNYHACVVGDLDHEIGDVIIIPRADAWQNHCPAGTMVTIEVKS